MKQNRTLLFAVTTLASLFVGHTVAVFSVATVGAQPAPCRPAISLSGDNLNIISLSAETTVSFPDPNASLTVSFPSGRPPLPVQLEPSSGGLTVTFPSGTTASIASPSGGVIVSFPSGRPPFQLAPSSGVLTVTFPSGGTVVTFPGRKVRVDGRNLQVVRAPIENLR